MANIGIVGGGIAGLYCAWKLFTEDKSKSHSVTLYEGLGRLGGRIETLDLHGFKAECGPMRFELEIEPLFKALAAALNIKFDKFPPPLSGSAEFPKYDLQSKERSAEHKQAVEKILGQGSHSEIVSGMLSHHTSALDLLKFGIYRLFNRTPADLNLTLAEVVSGGKSSKISQYAGRLTKTDYDSFRTEQELGGSLLHTLGFWNALSRVLSPGAVAKIRDTGTFYHLLPENPSASEWSIFWLRMFRPEADLWTITGGVDSIVTRLEARIKSDGFDPKMIKTDTTITSISEDKTGKLRLTTSIATLPEQFDHVILAIPAVPLRSLSETFTKKVRDFVNGVIPFPLLKVFVVLENAWWTEPPEPQQGAHLVPTREVHYFKPAAGSTEAMIMFYTDRPATAYWHPYIEPPHYRAQTTTREDFKTDLARQVAQLLPMQSGDFEAHVMRVRKSIVASAIRDWSERPFGAASHAWAPGIVVTDALAELKAFSLEKSQGTKNVHICGEAYSGYQGFIEGALETARDVVDSINV